MNKNQAIAYAQVTLDYMKSSIYNSELTSENFGKEMKQSFEIYPKNIIIHIAKSQIGACNDVKIYKLKKDKKYNKIILSYKKS